MEQQEPPVRTSEIVESIFPQQTESVSIADKINGKIAEIRSVLLASKNKNEEEEKIAIEKIQEILGNQDYSENEILYRLEKVYGEVMEISQQKNTETKPIGKKITEEGIHFLHDFDSGRIPPLKSSGLRNIAEGNGVVVEESDDSKEIIRKLKNIRDGVEEKKEPVFEKKQGAIVNKIEKEDPLENLKTERTHLQESIFSLKLTPLKKESDKLRLKNEELRLADIERFIKAGGEVKITPKIPVKSETSEIPVMKTSEPTRFVPITKETKQPLQNTEIKEVAPVEKIEEIEIKPEDVKRETLLETKKITVEKSIQKLGEPYIAKTGDTIWGVLKKRLSENEYINKLTPRERNFIMDNMKDTVSHLSKEQIRALGKGKDVSHPKKLDELDFSAIIKENIHLTRLLKRFE